MQAISAAAPTRRRLDGKPALAGGLGLVVVTGAGVAASTAYGVVFAGALVGLALMAAAVAVYRRDPVQALIWLWLIEIFNAPVSAAFGYGSSAGSAIRQADEVLVVLALCLTIWRLTTSRTRPSPLRLIALPTIGVAAFGLTGAVVHGVPIAVTLIGAWLALKLWIMIGITVSLPWKRGDIQRVYGIMTKVGLFVAIVGFADYFTHSAISHALHTSTYHGEAGGFRAEAVHSIFPHPGEYSLFMSVLFAVAFARFAVERNRSDLALTLLFAAAIVLSLRLKGFLSLAAVPLIITLVQSIAGKRGAFTILLAGALLVVGIYNVEGNVIAKQVATYTSSTETSARAQLYRTGERIAGSDFPLGAGFGRYASYASRIFYSPVYYAYGLNAIYGLSRAYPNFIDDTSWPSVIGETGYGGLAMYLVGIVALVIAIARRIRVASATSNLMPLAALCALAVLLIDSLGDPTLFSWLATTSFALILGPALATTSLGSKASRHSSISAMASSR